MIQNESLITLEIKEDELVAYFIEYLKKRTFIKAKNIATAYLLKAYKCVYNDNNIRILTRRFARILILTRNLCLIEKYNKNKVYRVINPIDFDFLEQKLIKNTKIKDFTIGAMNNV